MNKLERTIYDFVKKNQKLKTAIVKLYQLPFSVIGRARGKINCTKTYEVFDNLFFGFHDKPSLSHDGKLWGHRELSVFSNGIGSAEIGFYDIVSKTYNKVAKTTCCNYQQGSMLTILDNGSIIFNDCINNKPVSRLIDSDNNETQYPFHFGAISKNGVYAFTLSFKDFGLGLNGYGYEPCRNENFCDVNSNHISIFDLKNNTELYKIDIKDLFAKCKSLNNVEGVRYISHPQFSDDGNNVFFLCRCNNGKFNFSELVSLSLVSGELYHYPTGGMVSHLTWLGSNILAYASNDKGKDSYYIFEYGTDRVEEIDYFNCDGHPNAINSNIFITDTYPNRERIQKLFYVDLNDKSIENILSIYSPRRFVGSSRVDLHPRFSQCGKFVTVDSSHNNNRSQILIRL